MDTDYYVQLLWRDDGSDLATVFYTNDPSGLLAWRNGPDPMQWRHAAVLGPCTMVEAETIGDALVRGTRGAASYVRKIPHLAQFYGVDYALDANPPQTDATEPRYFYVFRTRQ